MNEKTKKAQKQLYNLLKQKPLTIEELQTILQINTNPIKFVCTTFHEYLLQGGFDEDYIQNFQKTLESLVLKSKPNELYHALKYMRKIMPKVLTMQETVYPQYETALRCLIVENKEINPYRFLKVLIYEIQNISYLKQILNTSFLYVNAKDEKGRHIVLNLLDHFLYLLEKPITLEILYFDQVIHLFLQNHNLHLDRHWIKKYCAILQEKMAQSPKEKMSYYKSLYDSLINSEITFETIEILNEKYHISPCVSITSQLETRKLLKKDFIVTIDSIDTMDMDDALSICKEKDHYHAKVYITDITHYVKENSNLSKEALLKSESLYLSDGTIHMFPSELATGLFSLNSSSSKPVFIYSFDIYENGQIQNFSISQDWVYVNRKLDYTQANKILKDGIEDETGKTLQNLYKAAMILRKYNPDKLVYRTLDDFKGVYHDKNQYAHRTSSEIIIEEFMITTNYLIASLFSQKGYPFLYRNHLGPENKNDMNQLLQLKQFIQEQYHEREKYLKLITHFLNMYPTAFYSLNNEGHFGLGLPCYSHSTSPIRRYPDIVVMRLIKEYILNNPTKELDQKWVPIIQKTADYCNERMKQNLQYQSEYERIKAFIKIK